MHTCCAVRTTRSRGLFFGLRFFVPRTRERGREVAGGRSAHSPRRGWRILWLRFRRLPRGCVGVGVDQEARLGLGVREALGPRVRVRASGLGIAVAGSRVRRAVKHSLNVGGVSLYGARGESRRGGGGMSQLTGSGTNSGRLGWRTGVFSFNFYVRLPSSGD